MRHELSRSLAMSTRVSCFLLDRSLDFGQQPPVHTETPVENLWMKRSCTVLDGCLQRVRWTRLMTLACVMGLGSFTGCGGPTGPTKYPLMGNVVREGEPISEGTIQMNPTGGGPAAQTIIKDGKFQFTKVNGPVEGKQEVVITRTLQRAEVPPGTPKKDADAIPETGFKNPMPPGGWLIETTIAKDQDLTKPVEFNVDNAAPANVKGGRKEKR